MYSKQIGGEVLGKGGYGCAIKPSVRCDKEGEVSKIMKKRNAELEMVENKVVKDIDPGNHFTLPEPEICSVDMARQPPSIRDDIRECDMFREEDYGNLAAIMMNDGGVGLNMEWREYLQYKFINKREDFNNILKGLWRVFYGLRIINERGYYHADIKSANILMNTKKNYEMNIIDFGLLTPLERIRGMNGYYAYPITQYLYRNVQRFYNDMRKVDDDSRLEGKWMFNLYKHDENIEYMRYVLEPFFAKIGENNDNAVKQQARNFCTHMAEKAVELSYDDFYDYFYRIHTSTFDIYSLGLVLAEFITEFPDDNIFQPLINLIKEMINIDDSSRINQREALERYEAFLTSVGIEPPVKPYGEEPVANIVLAPAAAQQQAGKRVGGKKKRRRNKTKKQNKLKQKKKRVKKHTRRKQLRNKL
jgi:serine/threonine protein kinase